LPIHFPQLDEQFEFLGMSPEFTSIQSTDSFEDDSGHLLFGFFKLVIREILLLV
jgi:hypothetical protein